MNNYELADAVLSALNPELGQIRASDLAAGLKVTEAQLHVSVDLIKQSHIHFVLRKKIQGFPGQYWIPPESKIEVEQFLEKGGFVAIFEKERQDAERFKRLQEGQAQAIIENTVIARQAVIDARAERDESSRQAKIAERWTIASVVAAVVSAIAALIAVFHSK